MKRKIIQINKALCNGCGNCVTSCAEGALQIIGGKARVVRDSFCDGLGVCIGNCPTGALKIIERDAPAFDEKAVKRHLKEAGKNDAGRRRPPATEGLPAGNPEGSALRRERVTPTHPPRTETSACGCPGSVARMLSPVKPTARPSSGKSPPSLLGHWPVQLRLVQPGAPFLRSKKLVVMADCAALACPDAHARFLGGNAVVIGCPKFDGAEDNVEKLASIFSESGITEAECVHMEVPCCRALQAQVNEALERSGKSLDCRETVVSVSGNVC